MVSVPSQTYVSEPGSWYHPRQSVCVSSLSSDLLGASCGPSHFRVKRLGTPGRLREGPVTSWIWFRSIVVKVLHHKPDVAGVWSLLGESRSMDLWGQWWQSQAPKVVTSLGSGPGIVYSAVWASSLRAGQGDSRYSITMVYISERPRDTFSLWPQVVSECVLYSLYIAYAK